MIRKEILDTLQDEPKTLDEIVRVIPVTRENAKYHLGVLFRRGSVCRWKKEGYSKKGRTPFYYGRVCGSELAIIKLLRAIVSGCPNHGGIPERPFVNDKRTRAMTDTEIDLIAAFLDAPVKYGGYKHSLKDAPEIYEYRRKGEVSCQGCVMVRLLGYTCDEFVAEFT